MRVSGWCEKKQNTKKIEGEKHPILKRTQSLRERLYQLRFDSKLPRESAERLCVLVSISVYSGVGVVSDLDLGLGLGLMGVVGMGVVWKTVCLGGAEMRDGRARWRVGNRKRGRAVRERGIIHQSNQFRFLLRGESCPSPQISTNNNNNKTQK
jgi:hypothetical protein